MIVIMQSTATKQEIEEVEYSLQNWGYDIHPIYGVERTVIAAVGAPTLDEGQVVEQVEAMPSVDHAVLIVKPYRFASKEYRQEKSTVRVDDKVIVGNNQFIMMASPRTNKTEKQQKTSARAVNAAGATVLRGGAYKPCTSPY